MRLSYFFFSKQKTAYEMRISDWSSDVCSSDLHRQEPQQHGGHRNAGRCQNQPRDHMGAIAAKRLTGGDRGHVAALRRPAAGLAAEKADQNPDLGDHHRRRHERSEEHTSELQSLMRISYAVFCLKKKKNN